MLYSHLRGAHFCSCLSSGCVLAISIVPMWVQARDFRESRAASRSPGHRLSFLHHSVLASWLCPCFASGNGRVHNCPSYPVRPSTPLCSAGNQVTLVCSVYIFKHVTVTGVYITMFVKYVAVMPKMASISQSHSQWDDLLLGSLLPSAVLPSGPRIFTNPIWGVPLPCSR